MEETVKNSGAQDVLRQLGCRIKQIRVNRGISQARLAEICSLPKASMSRIEAGKINMTMRTLLCIVTAFELSVAELLESLD